MFCILLKHGKEKILFSRMASPFETESSFLTQEQADHINERHVFRKEHVKTSKFGLQFDLVDMLKNVSELTWEENSEDAVLLDEG